ncbi:MAG: selenium metabolism-associated LysR family transcriptional regulator [Desulfobulbaceae bacterium]|nr:selenium metabolism-associated LysR family transcriptional regulator [Desulfobulbaceae bacterium]
MDLHRLEVFCKVVELKSFTKAAEAVFLSQPTVSEHIRTLEEMTGQRLIDRLGREIMPTQAGDILYRYARKILQLRDEAMQAMEQYGGNLAGQLLLGAGTIPGTYILPTFIGSFKKLYPAIQITLKIASSRLVAEMVLEGEVELGTVGARWNDANLEWQEIFEDELVLAVSPRHPWATRAAVALSELADEPFILRERTSGTRKVMTQLLAEQGFDTGKLQVVAEMGSTEAVRQSIKAEIGVSILSRQAVAQDLACGTVAVVPVEGVAFHRPFYLIRRKNRQPSPISSTFVSHLRGRGDQG